MSRWYMRWIFSSFKQDMAWLYLPPLLLLFAFSVGDPKLWTPAIGWAAILFLNLCDLGHVYVTAFRTYLRPVELRRSLRYLIAPLLILPAAYYLVNHQFQWFPRVTAYLILIHAIRQYYGQMRWYERLNGIHRRAASYFLYSLCLWPLIMHHFQNASPFGSPATPEVFHWPNPEIFQLMQVGYALLIAAWFAYEIRLSLKGSNEWNRRIAIAVPAILYPSAVLFADNLWACIIPLGVGHGLAYIGLTGLAIERLDKRPRRQAMARSAGTAVFMGGLIYWIAPFDPVQSPIAFTLAITPVYCHYFFDAFLWTGRHAEAGIVYARPELPAEAGTASSGDRVE